MDKFLAKMDSSSATLLLNKKTNKLFCALDNGTVIKAQQSLKSLKETEVLVEAGNLEDACVVDRNSGAVVVDTYTRK